MAIDPKTKTVTQTVGVVVLMGGLAWASVPFYDWFCRVTGFGGVTGVSEAGERRDPRSDDQGAVRCQPRARHAVGVQARRARDGAAHRRDGAGLLRGLQPHRPRCRGPANYNVTPYEAGGFFTKIDCFCFEEQVLQPGERVQMPVTFTWTPRSSMTARGSISTRSRCPIRSTRSTCPRTWPASGA